MSRHGWNSWTSVLTVLNTEFSVFSRPILLNKVFIYLLLFWVYFFAQSCGYFFRRYETCLCYNVEGFGKLCYSVESFDTITRFLFRRYNTKLHCWRYRIRRYEAPPYYCIMRISRERYADVCAGFIKFINRKTSEFIWLTSMRKLKNKLS